MMSLLLSNPGKLPVPFPEEFIEILQKLEPVNVFFPDDCLPHFRFCSSRLVPDQLVQPDSAGNVSGRRSAAAALSIAAEMGSRAAERNKPFITEMVWLI